ncbi:hypothetical protein LINPERHAP1_LOCUS9828 [Linum perenne]
MKRRQNVSTRLWLICSVWSSDILGRMLVLPMIHLEPKNLMSFMLEHGVSFYSAKCESNAKWVMSMGAVEARINLQG